METAAPRDATFAGPGPKHQPGPPGAGMRWSGEADPSEGEAGEAGRSGLALTAALSVRLFCCALRPVDLPCRDPMIDFGATKPPTPADLVGGYLLLFEQPVDSALVIVEVVAEGRDGHDFVGRSGFRRRAYSLHLTAPDSLLFSLSPLMYSRRGSGEVGKLRRAVRGAPSGLIGAGLSGE
jgi:hypothetical protein